MSQGHFDPTVTASGKCLGACLRKSPNSFLICFEPSCDFQDKSLDRIKVHIKREHSTVVCGKAVLFPTQVNTLLESRDSDEVEGECSEGPEAAAVLSGEDPTYEIPALPESRAGTEIEDFQVGNGDEEVLEVEQEGFKENSANPPAASDLAALPDSIEPSRSFGPNSASTAR
jgi:hypothetical protein